MRIADRSSARNYLKYLNKAKNDFAKTDLQIASGNRFTRISDDVSAGTRVLNTRMDMYKAETHLENVAVVNDQMSVAADSMDSMKEIFDRIHELALKGMSEDKLSDSGKKAIADEIKALKQNLVQLANTKYDKKFSFGGSNASQSAPFSLSQDGRMLYNGIATDIIQQDTDGSYYYMDGPDKKKIPMDEDIYLDVGMGITMKHSQLNDSNAMKISISGLDVLGFGKTAEGLSNNLYNILNDMEAAVRAGNTDTLGKLSDQLTLRMDEFSSNSTELGAKTSQLESMQTRLEKRVDGYKQRIQGLMGTDDAEAATTMKMNDYVLKAVLQMGARILPSSLMDFLR